MDMVCVDLCAGGFKYGVVMIPTQESWSKFHDIDLKFGKQGEEWLTLLASEKKIEVKRDRMWKTTGNLFFEYRYKGEPSGIATTKADYFAYILFDGSDNVATYIWETERLKKALSSMMKLQTCRKIMNAGDGGLTAGLLVPIAELGHLTRLICG